MRKRVAAPTRRTAARSREHLLDVRVRRSTARRRRNHRALRLVAGVTLWVAVAVGAWFGFHAIVNKFFLQNPEYNLRVVDADLDDLMSKDEAIRVAGLEIGKNIFRLDLGAAEEALKKIDQVATVQIRREWPDKVTLKITKRVPVAWLAKSGGSDGPSERALFVDADGRPIKPFRVESSDWRLPTIYCPDLSAVESGDTLACDDLRAALELLAENQRRPDSLLDIRSIDVTKGYALEVVDADKAVFHFAPQDPGSQLDRLQKLLANCRDTGRQVEFVDLIPKKYTPVRFVLASVQEETEKHKPSPTREKKR